MRTNTDSPSPSTGSTATAPRVSRRRFFALSGAVGVAAMSLSACTTDAVENALSSSVDPNELVAQALSALRGRATSGDAWSNFYDAQFTVLKQEFLRQCGTNKAGDMPQSCQDRLNEIPDNGTQDTSPQDALLAAAKAGDAGGVLTGLYAAACIEAAAPDTESVDALDLGAVSGGHNKDSDTFTNLLEFTYAAVYASGVALAADGGTNATVLRALATRLRALRDDCGELLDHLGVDVPRAAAGYTALEQLGLSEPTDTVSGAQYLHSAMAPLTQQLRMLASVATSPEAREFDARWCGLCARGEAVLEEMFGSNPQDTVIRGSE